MRSKLDLFQRTLTATKAAKNVLIANDCCCDGEEDDLDELTCEIKELDVGVANALANYYGEYLDLSGLKSISDKAAEALANFKGEAGMPWTRASNTACLHLEGLEKLSDKAVQALSKFNGELYLKDSISMKVEAAKKTAKAKKVVKKKAPTKKKAAKRVTKKKAVKKVETAGACERDLTAEELTKLKRWLAKNNNKHRSLKDIVLEVTRGRVLTIQQILMSLQDIGYKLRGKNPINSLLVLLYANKKAFKSNKGKFTAA